MVTWYLKRRGVFFCEKLATKEEKEIGNFLREYLFAFSKKDVKLLTSFFSDNATIYSNICGSRILNKTEYIQCLTQKIKEFTPICFDDVIIRVADRNNAVINSTYLSNTKRGVLGPLRISLGVERVDNFWKIVTIGPTEYKAGERSKNSTLWIN